VNGCGATTTIQLPSIGFPFEFTAMCSAQFNDCWHHVNIPICASDSLVYEIARRIRDNFPAGRKVLVELSDEPWNWGFRQSVTYQMLTRLSFPGKDWTNWSVHRTAQITQIFINEFNATGRGAEVVGLLNSQCAYPAMTQTILSNVQAQGITVPLWITAAPYIDPDNNAATVAAYGAANTAQIIDLWIHDLYDSPTSIGVDIQQHRAYIAAFNAATGANCQLYAYECGIETCVPSSVNNAIAQTRDAVYHPNWWIIEQDFYAWMQLMGFVRASVYAYDMIYVDATDWGMYHGPVQPYGRGDGSDGKADNRLCLALPGHTYSKSATTNQDQQNVSVRGSAFLNWMRAFSSSPLAKKLPLLPPRRRRR
jgi:hypothetical protein